MSVQYCRHRPLHVSCDLYLLIFMLLADVYVFAAGEKKSEE